MDFPLLLSKSDRFDNLFRCLQEIHINVCSVDNHAGGVYAGFEGDGSQTLYLQRDALLAAGLEAVHLSEDRASGRTEERPGLESVRKALREGDTLVVWKLDRLGRSLRDLVGTVKVCRKVTVVELRRAVKEQYHAGLAMLAECVEKCPEGMWLEGEHPRTFWRIAWHAAYFTHNYVVQNEAAFNGSVDDWPLAVRTVLGVGDTQKAIDVEPYELPEGVTPLTQREVQDYIAYVRGLIDATVDRLDLDSQETGFSWYPDMTKLSHELMNLRHIQGHVGQLSERLMARGIDTDWIAKSGGLEQ